MPPAKIRMCLACKVLLLGRAWEELREIALLPPDPGRTLSDLRINSLGRGVWGNTGVTVRSFSRCYFSDTDYRDRRRSRA